MTHGQLIQFKRDIRKFHKVVEPVCKHWGNGQEIVLSVLLQNLGFENKDYSLKEELKVVRDLIDIINNVCDYNEYHLTKWIRSEINMIYMAAIYS